MPTQNDSGFDGFVQQVVSDPKNPPEPLFLSGYLGPGSEDTHVRLYFNLNLTDYVDIPLDKILHKVPIPASESPMGGYYLWIEKDAQMKHGKAGGERIEAKWLEGRIQNEYRRMQMGGQVMERAITPTPGGTAPIAPVSILYPCTTTAPTKPADCCYPTQCGGSCTSMPPCPPTPVTPCTIPGAVCPTQQGNTPCPPCNTILNTPCGPCVTNNQPQTVCPPCPTLLIRQTFCPPCPTVQGQQTACPPCVTVQEQTACMPCQTMVQQTECIPCQSIPACPITPNCPTPQINPAALYGNLNVQLAQNPYFAQVQAMKTFAADPNCQVARMTYQNDPNCQFVPITRQPVADCMVQITPNTNKCCVSTPACPILTPWTPVINQQWVQQGVQQVAPNLNQNVYAAMTPQMQAGGYALPQAGPQAYLTYVGSPCQIPTPNTRYCCQAQREITPWTPLVQQGTPYVQQTPVYYEGGYQQLPNCNNTQIPGIPVNLGMYQYYPYQR